MYKRVKICSYFLNPRYKKLRHFHLSKAFSLPSAQTGIPESNGNQSSESPGNQFEDKVCNLIKYCPSDIDISKLDDEPLDVIDAGVAEEEIPQPKRKGVYMSKGIKVCIPDKMMPPGTCRHRIDLLPPTMPDDMRVIHFRNS